MGSRTPIGRPIAGAGEGIRFWSDYAEHVELAASLGLNAFRMGIEWARCQPSASTVPTEPPPWDEAALDHYADMVELVIDRGMQPIITLHHFTHPLWLGLDIWLDDRGPDLLVDAQIRIVDEINTRLMARGGKRMSHFLVYNEPSLIPLFFHFLEGRHPEVDRKGPDYPAPRVRHDAVALHHGLRRHPRPVRSEGLGHARAWDSPSRASAPTNGTSSSMTCSASGAGVSHARTWRPRSRSAEPRGAHGWTRSRDRS